MQTIDVSNLRRLGRGEECDVYQYARLQVIKCFRNDSCIRENGSSPKDVWEAQKYLASIGFAPPVGEFVRWKRGKVSGEGYISAKAAPGRSVDEDRLASDIYLTLQIHLDDLHNKNTGLYRGVPVVIDCGFDALKILSAKKKKEGKNA